MSNEPQITALVRADGSGEVSVDGDTSQVHADDIEGVRAAIIERVTAIAVAHDRPVRVATTDLDGLYPLIVHPSGSVDSDGPVIPVDDEGGETGEADAAGSDAGGADAVASDGGEDRESDGDVADTSDPDGAESDADAGNEVPVEAHEQGPLDVDSREHDSGTDAVSEDTTGEEGNYAPAPDESPVESALSADESPEAPVAYPEPSGSEPEDTDPASAPRQAEPGLIPPPPLGIDVLFAEEEADSDAEAEVGERFAAPMRRSTFRFAESPEHAPDEPAADPAVELTTGTEPSENAAVTHDHVGRHGSIDRGDHDETVAASETSDPLAALTADLSTDADAHDSALDLPAPGLNAFAPTADASDGLDDSAPTLDDFLQSRPSASVGPAKKGWQGLVTRLTGGLISPKPGKSERAHRNAIERVQRSMKGPRTIVVLNPKGGAHKTTATLLLAATFGIHRGGSTLAWDNNETRGTLGWRAQPSRHSNTAVDLLRDLDKFADVKSARVGYLDNYVRAQGDAQFDVLASDEDAAASSTIDAVAFKSLHHTLSRFYRVLVIDTGNNMRASNWEAAVDAADQLVVVTTVNEETAASAAWLLDGLRQKGHQDKVSQAVTILSSPGDTTQHELTQRLHAHFAALTRVVLEVPYDSGFQSGGPLNVDALSPQTREAWLQVTAAVADGL